MPTCLDYAKIAYAAYYTTTNQYYEPTPGHMVDDWQVNNWTTGGLFGSGLQGGLWLDASDVVIGICGTNAAQKGKFVHDLGADITLAVGSRPSRQCDAALALVRAARQVAGNRRISLTGHSLGGGIAQIVGVEQKLHFVTFNAPPMRRVARRQGYGYMGLDQDSLGLNFRIHRDPVSTSSILKEHLGMVINLDSRYATGLFGPHAKKNIWQSILESDFSDVDGYSGSV